MISGFVDYFITLGGLLCALIICVAIILTLLIFVACVVAKILELINPAHGQAFMSFIIKFISKIQGKLYSE